MGMSSSTLLLHLCLPLRSCRVFTALAALVATYNVLAIAQRDHLAEFIIIVQTSDDMTLKSPVVIIVPLTLHLRWNAHHPIVLCPLVTSTTVL